MTPKGRTAVAGLLVTVIAVRVSVSQPLTASIAGIVSDPGAALRHAADGWSLAGTLGGATAQGLRDLPLALYYWLGSQLGLSDHVLQTVWRVLVLLLALWGAIRLARALAVPGRAQSWTPWVGALLFSSGIVLVPTVVRSPLDGIAAATLPWVVAPLLTRGVGWRRAATSAAWLGLAGVGSPSWAAAALVAGLAAAIPRSRDQVVPALRWLVLAAVSCAWWVSAFVWETLHARDVSALLGGDDLRRDVADAVGRPDLALPLVLLVALGPLLVTVTALLLRPPGADLVFLAALGGAALVVAAVWLGGWDIPVFASFAADRPTSIVAPVSGWLALTGLVAWTPLAGPLGERLHSSAQWRLPAGRRELTASVLAVMCVLTTAAGAMAAAAEPGTTDEGRPGLAMQVSAWSSEAAPGRVLVLPPTSEGASAPSLGAALGDRPWVGRDSLPTSGAAGTSALDDLLGRLGRGDGGPGTSSALRRLGISYVLLHLDGSVAADRANPAALVRSALATQGGRRVAVLSGRGGSDETRAERLLDFGVRGRTELVEIWSVPGSAFGWVHPGSPIDVVGDAGTTSDLADAGVLGARATRFRGESTRGADFLSDSARRRDVDQRVAIDPYGPDLGPDEPRSVVPPDVAPVTTADRRISGARTVSASSSAADLDGALRRAGSDALAAIDATVFTSWQSRRGSTRAEWWEIELDVPTELAGTSVQFVRSLFSGRPVTRVEVQTDAGSQEYDVAADGLLVLQRSETTSRLRITVTGVEGTTEPDDSVGIAEVRIPGVTVRDELAVAGPRPRAWLLAARTGSFVHCVPAVPTAGTTSAPAAPPTVCDRGVSVDGPDTGSLDRIIRVDEAAGATGRTWVRAADTDQSAALAAMLAEPSVLAAGSSAAAQDLVTRPQAAADADVSTAWRPAAEDAEPTLTLSWPEPVDVSGLRLLLGDDDVASTPTLVRVSAEVLGAGPATAEAEVGVDGAVAFPTVRTRSITITFLESSGLTSISSLTGGARTAPIAVAEVELLGGPQVRYDGARVHALGCGSGPAVSIGGVAVRTALTTSAQAVVAGGPVRAELCDEVDLAVGAVEVGLAASYSWIPMGVLLTTDERMLDETGRVDGDSSLGGMVAFVPTPAGRGTRGPVAIDLDDSSAERTVVLATPAGSGWVAHGDDGALEPVTVDGWAQAWAVPAGVERVVLRYSAGGSLRGWVGLGAVGWALVVLFVVSASLSPARRRSG